MTRRKILESCEKLFFEKSFKNVSMQQVADSIWIKKASIYHHFGSKNELISECINASFEKYMLFIKSLALEWKEWWEFKSLLKSFLDFPEKQTNLFSIINRSSYQDDSTINELIQEKQKVIFNEVHKSMESQWWFTKEKTYLFLLLINQIWLKKSSYKKCEIDEDKTLNELENLFF